MGWIEKSVDDLPSFPRLDAQECMKRCICEAHNQPKKYGVMGLVLQLFFPYVLKVVLPVLSCINFLSFFFFLVKYVFAFGNWLFLLIIITIEINRPYTETDEPSRIVSKYQLAARYGRQDNANCAAQYDGCVVNFLDAFHGLINFFF